MRKTERGMGRGCNREKALFEKPIRGKDYS